MKSLMKKVYMWDYFPFVILLIGMIIFHIIIKLNYGDDLNFAKVLKENQFLIWTENRYVTWTSRFIIESIMITVLNCTPVLWKVIDVAIIILLAGSISKLFIKSNIRRNNWAIISLIFLYPFRDMSTAGWGTTTINYLWPISIGVYSLVIVNKILNNSKIKWYEYILSTLALIFASNAEQMCAILLIIYAGVTIYLFLKHRISYYIIGQTIWCVISILFILNCPGNAARKVSETATWFPDFDTLSIYNKLELGFSSSIAKFIFEPNIFFIILSLLVFAVIVIKHKNKTLYIISGIPFAASIFLGIFAYAVSKIFPKSPNIVTSVTKYGTITKENMHLIQSYIPIVILASVGVCFLVSLYFCFEKKNMGILVILIVLLGLASRIVIGFSPTIWASNDRTFIYMYLSLIICAVLIYKELSKEEIIKLKWINCITGIFVFISYIYLIAFTFILQIFINRENLMNFVKSLF